MKIARMMVVFFAVVSVNHFVFAETDSEDEDWITQCVQDHDGTNASPKVVQKYCVCMNNKMGDDEMRSICGWEKNHLMEKSDCQRESGFSPE